MWTAHDSCASMHHWHHLVGRSLSWWTWDLRVPTLFIFPSIVTIWHANTSLAAPQGLYAYLFLIPTWRPILCALVPCLHPHLLHPHVDSHPSYRCLPDHIPIVYLCLQPYSSILY